MRIDGPNPVPPAKPAEVSPVGKKAAQPVSQHIGLPEDKVVQHEADSKMRATSVTVEMQRGNRLVFKFVDESTGEVIQQIPSEQMLKIAQSADISLDLDNKDQERK